MRILIGMPDRNSTGGPIACEPPFVRALRQSGVDVVEETYAYGDRESPMGFGRRVLRVLGTAGRLRRRLSGDPFDLVHLNTAFDPKALLRDTVIVRMVKRSGSKLFLKFHGSDARLLGSRNPAWSVLRRRLLSHTDGIGALSFEEQANFLRAGVPEGKVFVVKNVVERNTRGGELNFAGRMGLPGNMPWLLFAGRFIPAKGLLDVIRACGWLRARGKDFLLVCLGDGPARRDAEHEVERLNLKQQVLFEGYIPEEQADGFYARSAVLLFPTYHQEGLSMVLLKAAAAGLPIITTRIRAAADYLREPENCLWVEPRNPEMLAEKIAYLLDHPEVRDLMRSNNLELARRFSPELVTPEYLEIYRRIING